MTTEPLAVLCLVIACAGCLYLACAAIVAARFAPEPAAEARSLPPVTLLKPLKGDEPALFRNLASFCNQDYPAPIQMVLGVSVANDAAISAVKRLEAVFPDRDLELIVDPTVHGANLKISNLINMTPAARHACLVLSDSDIEAPPDYLRRVAGALLEPGVGGVTCLYHGVPVAGFWSRMSALAIDSHFLPNVLVGLHFGLATPCFGSTIALRRDRLDEIGGFGAFADVLADDYAIGAALRARNFRIAIPRFLVSHCCAETSLAEVWRQELRWARTIRTVDFRGHAGSVATHPLPFALLALAAGAPAAGLILAILALAGRIVLLHVLARGRALALPPYWMVPVRDLLSFAIFVWSFFGHGLIWRGRRYRVGADGVLTAD